jgi:hypothetical protein
MIREADSALIVSRNGVCAVRTLAFDSVAELKGELASNSYHCGNDRSLFVTD